MHPLRSKAFCPFQMKLANGGWHKVFGVVTNRDLPGDELVRWSRQRCGKSLSSTRSRGEEVHGVLKRVT